VHAFRLPHTLHIVKQFSESWYSASSSLDLIGFLDVYFAGSIDRKSTSDTCHFLRSSLVCWSSQKQSLVAQSTTDAKYAVAAPKSYGLFTP
jgi:hypothetical protein